VTQGMAEHRVRDGGRVDVVVGALYAQPELVDSHRMAAIERNGVSLERRARAIRRCRSVAHDVSAAPRASDSTSRANTMMRLAAL